MKSILRSLFGSEPRNDSLQVPFLFYGEPSPRSVRDAAQDFIERWEGGFQDDPDDTANWVDGHLLGTKYGVTPRALARHREIPPQDLKSHHIRDLDLDEAVEIAVEQYYTGTGLDELPWVPLTEAAMDSAYLSGPGTSIRALQGLILVAQDGIIGPLTVRAFTDFWVEKGPRQALDEFRRWRHRRFDRLGRKYPKKKKFVKGWKRRADGFTADNPGWLDLWAPRRAA